MGTEAVASFLGGTNYPPVSRRAVEPDFGPLPRRPPFTGPRRVGMPGPGDAEAGTGDSRERGQ